MKHPAITCNLCGTHLVVAYGGQADGFGLVLKNPSKESRFLIVEATATDSMHLCVHCVRGLKDLFQYMAK